MFNQIPLKTLALAIVPALALAGCGNQPGTASASRDFVSAVGSSTVYPFANIAAEQFAAANAGMETPKVESTGTGGGIERFCSGIGAGTPDIVNASRRMKASEFESCSANGVTEIIEIQIGIDGLGCQSEWQAADRQAVERCRSVAAGQADPRLRSAEHFGHP